MLSKTFHLKCPKGGAGATSTKVYFPSFWYRYQIITSTFCQKKTNLYSRVSLPSHRGANASSKLFSVDQSKLFTEKLVPVPKIGTGTKNWYRYQKWYWSRPTPPESFKKPERQQQQDTDRVVDTVFQNSDEISEEDTCKICYTKKRTHGFVHAAQPRLHSTLKCGCERRAPRPAYFSEKNARESVEVLSQCFAQRSKWCDVTVKTFSSAKRCLK